MKIRALCVLLCAMGPLIPLSAVAQVKSDTNGIEATITVQGKDLVLNDPDYTSTPDQYGGFVIGVKLPEKGIIASECPPDNALIVEMGDIVLPYQNSPIHISRSLIERKKSYYSELLKLSAENKTIKINIWGGSEDLRMEGGNLYAPYCIVSFSGFEK